jgi:stage IV sporulation protein FB
VHPFFFLVFFVAFIQGFLYEVLLLFAIVLIHELGHACTAKAYGWRVVKVELLPFGGVAEVDEHGNRPPREEAVVILAGPLMNVIMIVFAFLFQGIGWWQQDFVYLFVEYNVILLLFNLLPIWPLDGGKLLQLGIGLFLPFKKAIRYSLLTSGVCLTLYFIVIVLYYPLYLSLWIVGLFLIVAQYLEWKQSPYQFMRFLMERYRLQQDGKTNPEHRVRTVTVSSSRRLSACVDRLHKDKTHYFCLIDERGRLQHIINEKELLEAYFKTNTHLTGVKIGDLCA